MAKLSSTGALLEVGDQGIWVTFARGMERRAAGEFTDLCLKVGQKLYGLSPPEESPDGSAEAEENDIEASIRKELEGYKAPTSKQQPDKTGQVFTKVRVDVDCVFFLKTRSPVQPVEFCRRICEDAKACSNPMERETRYINRLTPITSMDKASEKGIERAASKALSPWFSLKTDVVPDLDGSTSSNEHPAGEKSNTYAIRHSIRNNTEIHFSDLVKQVASLIDDDKHKVNLNNPDKVVLVDIFQNFCGVGVIDGADWNDLRKFNVNELYKVSPK